MNSFRILSYIFLCYFTLVTFASLINAKDNTPDDQHIHYIIEPSSHPISLRLYFPIGFLNETPNQAGATQTIAYHFQDAINKAFLNKFTIHTEVTPQSTVYSIDNLSEDNLEQALHAFHTIISDPYFNHIDDHLLSLPQNIFISENELSFFENTPFSFAKTLCTDCYELKNFYTTHYLKTPLVIIGTGNLDPNLFKTIGKKILMHPQTHAHPYHQEIPKIYFKINHALSNKIVIKTHENALYNELFFNTITPIESISQSSKKIESFIIYKIATHAIEYIVNSFSEGKIDTQSTIKSIHPECIHSLIHFKTQKDGSEILKLLSNVFYNIHQETDLLSTALHYAKQKTNDELTEMIINFSLKDSIEQADQCINFLNNHLISLNENLNDYTLSDILKIAHSKIEHIADESVILFLQNSLLKNDYYALLNTTDSASEKTLIEQFKAIQNQFLNLSEDCEGLNIQRLKYSYCFNKHNLCTFQFENGFKLNLSGAHSPENTVLALEFGNGYSTPSESLQKQSEWIWLMENVLFSIYEPLIASNNSLNYHIQTDKNRFILHHHTHKIYLPQSLETIAYFFKNFDNHFISDSEFKSKIIKAYTKYQKISADEILKKYLSLTAYDYNLKAFTPSLENLLKWSIHDFKVALKNTLNDYPIKLNIVGDYLSNNEIHELNSYVIEPTQTHIAPLNRSNIKATALPIIDVISHQNPEIITYEDPQDARDILCIYWKIKHTHHSEFIRELEVLSHWYADLITHKLYAAWDNFYTVQPFTQKSLNSDYILFGCSIDVHASDTDNLILFLKNLLKKLDLATQINFEAFSNTLNTIIESIHTGYTESIHTPDDLKNIFNEKLKMDLHFLLETAQTLVNIDHLSTESLIDAIKPNLSTIIYYLNLIHKNNPLDYIENTLNYYKNKLLEYGQLNSEKLEPFYNDLQLNQTAFYDYKAQLISLYHTLHFKIFQFYLILSQYLEHTPSNQDTLIAHQEINHLLNNLHIIFTQINQPQTITQNEILLLKQNINVILLKIKEQNTVIANSHLETTINHFENELIKVFQNIDILEKNITHCYTIIQNNYQILINFTTNTPSNIHQCRLEDFINHYDLLNTFNQLKTAYAYVETIKKQTIYKLWLLLNPIAPNDGHIHPDDNNLLTAIQSTLHYQLPYLYSTDYWLNDILLTLNEQPDNLNCAENISQHYEHISLKDIQFIIQYMLSFNKMNILKIMPKTSIESGLE